MRSLDCNEVAHERLAARSLNKVPALPLTISIPIAFSYRAVQTMQELLLFVDGALFMAKFPFCLSSAIRFP